MCVAGVDGWEGERVSIAGILQTEREDGAGM